MRRVAGNAGFLRNHLCAVFLPIFSVDIFLRIGYHKLYEGSKLALFIGFVAAVAAVVAALSVLLLYLDKKKDDEELEHYLDCSIQ